MFVDRQMDPFQVKLESELQALGFVLTEDPKFCDIIIASDRRDARQAVLNLQIAKDDPHQIYIQTSAEAVMADFNVYDYSLGLLKGESERAIQIPAVDMFSNFCPNLYALSLQDAPVKREPRKVFPSSPKIDFIYSNGGAIWRRKIFEHFNQHYEIRSYGNFLNNQSHEARSSWSSGWREEKLNLHQQNDYSLALENTFANGYTTEKILTPLEVGTIPIYFGHPAIEEQINPETFLALYDTSQAGLDDVFSRLSSLSFDKFDFMLREPIFSVEQLTFHAILRNKRREFLLNLAAGDISVFRPVGYAKDLHLRESLREVKVSKVLANSKKILNNSLRWSKP